MNKSIIKSATFIFSVGGLLSTIGGFISDVLMPIAPFGLYISIFMLIGLMGSIIIHFIPAIDNRFQNFSYWWIPVPVCFLVSTVIFFVAYSLGKFSGEQGYLASNFEIFSCVQKEFNIISKNIQEININTKETAQNTEEISHKIDNVKKENSDDPRKELANRGIDWTDEKFAEIIRNRDYENLNLFLEGGYNIYAVDDYEYPILLNDLIFETEDYQNIISLFVKNGYDLNKKIRFNHDYNMLSAVFATNNNLYSIRSKINDFLAQEEKLHTLSTLEASFIYKQKFSDEFLMFIKNSLNLDIQSGYILREKIYQYILNDKTIQSLLKKGKLNKLNSDDENEEFQKTINWVNQEEKTLKQLKKYI